MAAPIGLDIGSSAVRAAQINHGRNGTSLERFGEVKLPTGAVRDGEIVDPDVVVTALKDLWKSAKLKGRQVLVGLANQQVVVRRLELPYMTESELRATLPLQVDGLIPIPVDEAVLDFCYLGVQTNEDGERMVRVMVVAALRTMVDELLSVVRGAKLDPVGIDLDAFAALRSLTPPDIVAESTTELLVDVGATVTDLVVHRNGAPHFVRTLLFGGQSVTAMLADRLELELPEAERVKLELARSGAGRLVADPQPGATQDAAGGVDEPDDPGTATAPQRAVGAQAQASTAPQQAVGAPERASTAPQQAAGAPERASTAPQQAPSAEDDDAVEIIRTQTRRLINEIKGSIDYCASQPEIPSIEQLVLTGGASHWPGLASTMADELGLDITTGSPLHMVEIGSGVDEDELAQTAPRLAVAVGLALGADR